MEEKSTESMEKMEKPSEKSGQKNMMPIVIIGVVFVLAVLGFVLMRGKKNAPANEMGTSQSAQDASMMTSPDAGTSTAASASPSLLFDENDTSVKTFTIDAGSFYYNPSTIKVKKGDKVKVVITSKDMMHNFIIDEYNVKSPITKAGETSTVEFVADKTGTFEYYCGVGQHRAHGQVGKLVVE
jgi:nitrosocyanin